LNELIAKHAGKDVAQVKLDTERDKFLTAQEALDYGLIDRIVKKASEIKAK